MASGKLRWWSKGREVALWAITLINSTVEGKNSRLTHLKAFVLKGRGYKKVLKERAGWPAESHLKGGQFLKQADAKVKGRIRDNNEGRRTSLTPK